MPLNRAPGRRAPSSRESSRRVLPRGRVVEEVLHPEKLRVETGVTAETRTRLNREPLTGFLRGSQDYFRVATTLILVIGKLRSMEPISSL